MGEKTFKVKVPETLISEINKYCKPTTSVLGDIHTYCSFGESYEIYKSYGDTTSKGYYYHLTAGI